MTPLHAAQHSINLFEKLNANNQQKHVYHHTIALNISGRIDEKIFNEALRELTLRHEMLHSALLLNNNTAYFQTTPIDYFAQDTLLNKVDISYLPPQPLEKLPDTLRMLNKEKIIYEPFDLEKAPLWRNILLKYSETAYQFLLVIHHLIIDSDSQNILLRDLSEIYNALIEKREPQLPPLDNLANLGYDKDRTKMEDGRYWQQQLEGMTTLPLQTDYPPQKTFRYVGDRFYFQLEPETVQRLEQVAKSSHIHFETILLTALFAILYRYTAETDITLAFTTSIRNEFGTDAKNSINCFINSTPIRAIFNSPISFIELLKNIDALKAEAFTHQVPLNEIMTIAMGPKTKNADQVALPFNILFNFNEAKTPLTLLNTQPTYPMELSLGCTKFENFGVNIDKEATGNYHGFIEFNADLFSAETIKRFTDHFAVLLKQISLDPNQSISAFPILSEEESLLFHRYYQNNKFTDYTNFVPKEFSRIAKASPESIAIVFHQEEGSPVQMTYGEVDKISEDLAAYLTNINIGPEKTIGICLSRSPNLLIAILAVFKAGGVVVTMENNFENINSSESLLLHKISNTIITTVIVDNQTENLFSNMPSKFFRLNIENKTYKNMVKRLGLSYQPPKLSPHHLAYIMYTSGTTGKPKGVMIEHGSLTNLMYAIKDRNLAQGSKVLCTAPPTFDCFIWEFLEAIATQGECHLIDEKRRLSALTQQQIIQEYGINCATLLPDTIKHLDPSTLPSLTDVISMGNIPHKDTIELWQRHHKSIRNEYGPTETTICTTEFICNPSVPYTVIGKPIRNNNIYILDQNYNICPPNVSGEIYIGGAGVARGYVDSALTREKFPSLFFYPARHAFSTPLRTPESQDASSPILTKNLKRHRKEIDLPISKKQKLTIQQDRMRLYATGDLARYVVMPDNTLAINFIGRKDRQIKKHGVRIEMDGVEALLRSNPAIKDVYIKANDTKDALIAYIVPTSDKSISKTDIDQFLKKTSLQYIAWPQTVISMKELPINKNGKINIKALPLPEDMVIENHPPQTELEVILCKIWANILRISVSQIDITKSFREHGGDSLALGELQITLNDSLQLAISINILDKDMTISSLAILIDSLNSTSAPEENNFFSSPFSFFSSNNNHSLAFQPFAPCEEPKNSL